MLNKMRYKCDPHKHPYRSIHKDTQHARMHTRTRTHARTLARIYIHTEIEIGAHSVTNILVVYGGLFGAKNTHSNRTQTEFIVGVVVAAAVITIIIAIAIATSMFWPASKTFYQAVVAMEHHHPRFNVLLDVLF